MHVNWMFVCSRMQDWFMLVFCPLFIFIIEVLIYALVWILGFQNILKAWVWCCCISSNSLEISSINVPKKLKHWGLHACVTLLIAYVWTVWQGWNSGKYPFFLYLCFCEVIKAYMWQILDVQRHCIVHVLDKMGN